MYNALRLYFRREFIARPHGSPLSGGKNYSNVTLGKYNCLYIKLSARTGNGGLPCGRIISAPTKLRKQLKCYARVIMFELLQTVFTNGVQRHAAGGSPILNCTKYDKVTLGKYNCLYIKLSTRTGNGSIPCNCKLLVEKRFLHYNII